MQNKEKKNETRFDAKKAKKQKFKKYNFKYLSKEDAYLCPAGIKLTRLNNTIKKDEGSKKKIWFQRIPEMQTYCRMHEK